MRRRRGSDSLDFEVEAIAVCRRHRAGSVGILETVKHGLKVRRFKVAGERKLPLALGKREGDGLIARPLSSQDNADPNRARDCSRGSSTVDEEVPRPV